MSLHAIDTASIRGPRETGALVVLADVSPWLRPRLLRLAPWPAQLRFSGKPADTLPAAEADPARRPVAILEGGEPVGFFVLHRGPVDSLAPGEDDLLVRGFMVDRLHQSRGIGGRALAQLPSFAREREPHARRLVLGVNVRNHVARHAYLRAGFHDTGEVYLGGALGPQHVLVRPL